MLMIRKKRRGLSLVELAIALGVFGVILSAIWTVSASMMEASKQQQLSEDISVVVKNVRALYAGQSSISGNVTALVPQLISQGAIPSDLIRTPATGCSNTPFNGVTGCLDHQWGSESAYLTGTPNGSFQVCAWNPAFGAGESCNPIAYPGSSSTSQQFFAIEIIGLTPASCVNAVVNNSGPLAPPGLIDVTFNNNIDIMSTGPWAHQLPVSVANATSFCQVGGGLTPAIDFVYKLRPPES